MMVEIQIADFRAELALLIGRRRTGFHMMASQTDPALTSTVDNVFVVERQKLADAWRNNQRRAMVKIGATGQFPAGTGAIHVAAKLHEETIREACSNVEHRVKRILNVSLSAELPPCCEVARKSFDVFVSECFDQARRHLLGPPRSSGGMMESSAAARASISWNTLRLEIVNNFELMIMEAKKAASTAVPASSTVFNVSGIGARVNLNSTDQSSNVITINKAELFTRLRREVESQVPEDERPAIREQIDRMEKAESKSAMLGAYSEWVRLIASHASIFSAYVPALAQLLM